MIDARRMEVYASVFDAENNIVEPTKAVILDEYSFQALLQNIKLFFLVTVLQNASRCLSKIRTLFLYQKKSGRQPKLLAN